METFEAISSRRSIRKFDGREIPREIIEKILKAAILAPSAKNRQPWKFVVVTNKDKADIISAMSAGISSAKSGGGLLPYNEHIVRGAEYTLEIMRQAPVTVFVFNTETDYMSEIGGIGGQLANSTNVQSIGAAIQNMLLAATNLGVGSLWICDVFTAYKEICEWLGETNRMIAAVSFGYADESPNPRPRKSFDDVVVWR